jgi:hypothetical protein
MLRFTYDCDIYYICCCAGAGYGEKNRDGYCAAVALLIPVSVFQKYQIVVCSVSPYQGKPCNYV